MLSDFLERLYLLTHHDTEAVKDWDRWQRLREDRKLLRLEMQLYKAEREHELEQIAQVMGELDYADSLADSFQGGPGPE